MSLNSATYAEAKSSYKPPKRSGFKGKADTPSLRSKTRLKAKAKPKRARKKRLTTGHLKKRAWKEFSIFIRTRGANEAGMNKCVTCGVVAHWKTLQAGHFIRGRLNNNLFNETACWAQCYSCNVGKQGNVVIFYKFMLKEYGQDWIDHLIWRNNQTHKWEPGELQTIWELYQKLNAKNPLVKES